MLSFPTARKIFWGAVSPAHILRHGLGADREGLPGFPLHGGDLNHAVRCVAVGDIDDRLLPICPADAGDDVFIDDRVGKGSAVVPLKDIDLQFILPRFGAQPERPGICGGYLGVFLDDNTVDIALPIYL